MQVITSSCVCVHDCLTNVKRSWRYFTNYRRQNTFWCGESI